ncbi:MAG: hypothetical protein Q8P90_05810 [bacterium]|nr:hypothetical protein [bacterium]
MRNSNSRFHNPYFKNNKTKSKEAKVSWQLKGDGWAYAGIFILILSVLLYLAFSNRWLWMDYITVRGNQYLEVSEIANPTREVLAEKRWFIIPQRFYPITNLKKIEERVYDQISKSVAIETLHVEKKFPNIIQITVEERIPGLAYILGNVYYYLDETGIVTDEKIAEQDLNPHFPRIRDHNLERTIKVGEPVFKPEIIDFMNVLNKKFTETTGLSIAEYAIQPVSCQQKEYVAETIFANEIKETEDEDVKNEKIQILERLRKSEITVDQSLDLLEEIKILELVEVGEEGIDVSGNKSFVQLEVKYEPTECNYVAVLQDVTIVIQDGPSVYFDTNLDIDKQLSNLQTVLKDKVDNPMDLQYIDVRFIDKVYYR